jgi:hypothetical protein
LTLVDALKSEPQRSCTYKALLQKLSDEEKEALQFALRNPAKSVREIHDILGNAGHIIGRETLTVHRKGTCATCASA